MPCFFFFTWRPQAFPCISTGVYSFPAAPAAQIAVGTTRDWIQKHPEHEVSPSEARPTPPFQVDVTFCCFNEADAQLYEQLLA